MHRAAVLVLSILVLASAGGTAPAALAQTTGTRTTGRTPMRERFVTIYVRAAQGTAVASAVAVLNGSIVVPADAQGFIRIELRPPVRLPMQVDIHAPGYVRRELMIEGVEIGTIEVYLELEKTTTPRAERTVSVESLSSDTRNASEKLEDEGERAILQGEYARGERLLRSAYGLTPQSSLVCVNLGVAILRQGRFEEAIPYLEKAHQLAPYTPVAAGNLGLVRWIQGRHDECYVLLERAIGLGFESRYARYCLGVLALGRRDYKQAAAILGVLDAKRFRYRDLYLSLALRGLRQPKLATKAFQEFLHQHSIELIGATTPRGNVQQSAPGPAAPTS